MLSEKEFWRKKRDDRKIADKVIEIISELLDKAPIRNVESHLGEETRNKHQRFIIITPRFFDLGLGETSDIQRKSVLDLVDRELSESGYSFAYNPDTEVAEVRSSER